MRIIKSFFILLIIIFFTGCGFHLRGAYQLPLQLHVMYLQSTTPYSDFTKQLKTTLAFSKVRLVNNPQQASIILSILQENFSTFQTTVGDSTQTRSYNAVYTVTYNLQNKYGRVIIGPKTVSDSSTITVNQNEILENSNKLNITKQTLIRNLIMKLMFQLSSKDTITAVKKYGR